VEFAPTDWVTATLGLRFDYNTATKEFFSPRLAAVFKPAPGQFIRLGVARSFRKPPFFETDMHVSVRFPADSPITGDGQEKFLEFMTRVIGNGNIRNEDLVSFEAGYLGQYLDGKLTLTLDLFCNIPTDRVTFTQRVTLDEQGLPDLDRSSFMFENSDVALYIFGGELSVRYSPARNLSLLAWYSHRQVFEGSQYIGYENPKNLMGLGGRFRTDSGLLGSLYAFSRSGFWDNFVENPSGILETPLRRYLDHHVLLLGKLGWKLSVTGDVDLEIGVRLYLPINFSTPHFSYHERGGGVTYQGRVFGGEELARMVTAYLEGSY
jgi:outer membrane receptor protein involved in Fe transport